MANRLRIMIRTGSFVATFLLIVVLSAPVAAQTPAPAPAAPPAVTRPLDPRELRTHIYVMEGALMRAVSAGAQRFNREIRTFVPSMMMLSGEPQARGVYLEGYGVFFDVGVPVLGQSMVWNIGPMLQQDDRDLEGIRALRAQIQKMQPGPDRAAAEAWLARMEFSSGLARSSFDSLPAPAPGRMQAPTALAIPDAAAKAPAKAAAESAPASTAVSSSQQPSITIDRKNLQDPNAINQVYTDAVRDALVDAMINFSVPIRIAPDEWLTVAARDNMQRDSLAPSDPYEEVVTIILRIKGSDLDAYRRGEIDGAEVRRRVQLREF